MVYAVRTRNCADCGQEVTGRLPMVKDIRCIACAITRAANAAREMAAKSGPAYDRWLETRGPQGRPRAEQQSGA